MEKVKPEQLKLFKRIFAAYKKNKRGMTFEEYLNTQVKMKAQLDALGRK